MSKQFDPATPRQHFERRLSALKSDRVGWESEWRDQQDFILPNRGRWFETETNKGTRRTRKIYDGTATYAARTLASGLMAGITSPARQWFRLGTPDPELMKFAPVKLWLETVETRMAGMFANSNIYNTLSSAYEELGVFGTNPVLLYEDRQDIIRGYGLTIGEYFLAVDDRDEVNTMIREMQWTVGQAARRFGVEKLSATSRNLYESGRIDAPIFVCHIIEPNDEYRPGILGWKGKPWRSVWWETGCVGDGLLDVKGFNSKPFIAPRWKVLGRDAYGRGPGSDVLGDAISLQAMTKKKARAVDKQIDPAVNLPGTMKAGGASYSLDPGATNYIDGMGQGVNAAPAQTVQPNLSYFVADIQEVQRRIDHGFFKDLFLMLQQMERSQITATEIIERKAEKLIGLSPVVERLNDEALEPLIDRSFEIMMSDLDADGQPRLIPPPPKELQGIKLETQFLSIFRQAQEQEEVARTVGYVQNLALMAQAVGDPSVMDNVDTDEAAQILGNRGGAPARVITPVEKRDAIRQQRAKKQQAVEQQQQAMQAVEAAKALGQASVNPNQTALGAIMGV